MVGGYGQNALLLPPQLRNSGGVEGAPAAALPAASRHDGTREEGEKGEESERVRFPTMARAGVE